jgi:hypothetical protein
MHACISGAVRSKMMTERSILSENAGDRIVVDTGSGGVDPPNASDG